MANPFSSIADALKGLVSPRKTQAGNSSGLFVPQSRTITRLLFADIEDATIQADLGNIAPAARLITAARNDGTVLGQVQTRHDGLLQLPRKIEGPDKEIERDLRDNFDDVFEPAVLSALSEDGGHLGLMLAEFVYPKNSPNNEVLIRQEPEFLQYLRMEDNWYFNTGAGRILIEPGDGHWALGLPGGRLYPWRRGNWKAIARAFTAKEHAIYFAHQWSQTLAHPAKVATTARASSQEEREMMQYLLEYWGSNQTFVLPEGWELEIVQPTSVGFEIFMKMIEGADKEIILALSGQLPTTTGGTAFSNTAIHASIKSDLIQSDANTLANFLNRQCIPQWVARRYGPERAAKGSPRVSWDVTPPKDRNAEATAQNTAAQALEKAVTSMTTAGSTKTIDVAAYLAGYGFPIIDRPASAPALPDDGEHSAFPLVKLRSVKR